MVSKQWQRTQRFIMHAGLALGTALPLYFFETEYATWLKIMIIGLGYLILFPLVRWLHRRYAVTFVKVYHCEYEVAARVIQRLLNAQRLPFTKQSGPEQVVFQIRPGKMQLVVDAFMLNMLLDDHLKPEVATKLTLQPETVDNAAQMQQLRSALDEAFAI